MWNTAFLVGLFAALIGQANAAELLLEGNRECDKPQVKSGAYSLNISRHMPPLRLPADNPLTHEGVELGRKLFHEKRLSYNSIQSCASCHQQSAAFTDANRAFSLGVDSKEGKRNSMPLFNLGWSSSYFWDGRAPSLRAQALMPIQDVLEMHESLENVVHKLNNAPEYPPLFSAAFGDAEVTEERVGLALEQFMLTLVSQNSKYDRYMLGRGDLTSLEHRGRQLFFGTGRGSRGPRGRGLGCVQCHGGVLFTDNRFHNNGLDAVPPDAGLADVTGSEMDAGKFKTPSLRNIAVTGPYMHDGRFETLEETIEHYNSGLRFAPNLAPVLRQQFFGGLKLSKDDKAALVAFLKTLTDEEFIGTGKGESVFQSKAPDN